MSSTMSSNMRMGTLVVCAAVLAVVTAGTAAAVEIDMQLIIKPKLKTIGTERVFIGPVMLEPRKQMAGSERARSRIEYAAPRELERYLYKLLRRETRLTLVESDFTVDPPSDNLQAFSGNREFWLGLGTETGADFIVAAAIDIQVLDRAGYQTEEYVSPEDGKTYFRQVLIEETGFSYDILLMVFAGATGELVHQEQITAFKEREDQKLDEYAGMFNDVYTLENRLAGVFVPRAIAAKRYLFKD